MYRRRIDEARISVYSETVRGVQIVLDRIRAEAFPAASSSLITRTTQGDYHSILTVSFAEPQR